MRLFDLHCDTPYRCFVENLSFNDNRLAVSAGKGEYLSDWRQCFAVWVKDGMEKPYSFYKAVISDFKKRICCKPENLTPYFTLENGSLIDSTERLLELKADGIRSVTLTWNSENSIAGGANTEKGLTGFGCQVINEMNSLKIACDLSHLNRKSFYGAIGKAEYPFASHSNSYELCRHIRNLTDEQIKLIAEKNGIIGLCFYPEFLGGKPFERIYQNIYRLLDMGFEDNISIGSDFDGAEMDPQLDGTDKIAALYAFLEQKGLEKMLLDKIFYANAVKFFDKTAEMV